MPTHAPHRVAILALDTVVTFDLAVPCTVFGDPDSEPGAQSLYEVRVCAAPPKRGKGRTLSVPTTGGFDLHVSHGLRTLRWADTIVVPGYSPIDAELPAPVIAALRTASARGARIVSICTGAFALAAAGLLDGQRAATHWMAAEQLAATYADVKVDADVLYVDNGQVCTSAGVAAGIDLCLHLVRRDFGAKAANAIARAMVVAPHRSGGQAQFAEAPVPAMVEGGLERTRRWMLARLGERLTLETMASHASMSRRSFTRHFAEETGTTPLQWLFVQRVLHARQLLESTRYSVDRVAELSGFGTAPSLRAHFTRALGTTPLAYRSSFRG